MGCSGAVAEVLEIEAEAGQILAQSVGIVALLLFRAGHGKHLADQLLLPMALAGQGSFTTHVLSSHLKSNCLVIEAFLPVRFACDEVERQVRVSVLPA